MPLMYEMHASCRHALAGSHTRCASGQLTRPAWCTTKGIATNALSSNQQTVTDGDLCHALHAPMASWVCAAMATWHSRSFLQDSLALTTRLDLHIHLLEVENSHRRLLLPSFQAGAIKLQRGELGRQL